MKKVLLLFLFIFCVLFIGCSIEKSYDDLGKLQSISIENGSFFTTSKSLIVSKDGEDIYYTCVMGCVHGKVGDSVQREYRSDITTTRIWINDHSYQETQSGEM